MITRILKIVFIAWIALWLMFAVRELFIKANVRDYKALLGRSLEGKHAYITGQPLYDFLAYCKKALPEKATCELVGLEEGSLEARRSVNCLYPLVKSGDPDYILVFNKAGYAREGYKSFAGMSADTYILVRVGGK